MTQETQETITKTDEDRQFHLIIKLSNNEYVQSNYYDKVEGNKYTPAELGKAARLLTEGLTKGTYEIIIRWVG